MALTEKVLATVKATLPAVAQAGPSFTAHFYKRMFAAHPELLNTFNLANQAQGKQQKALFSAIAASAVCVLEEGRLPTELIEGVNHKHAALNVLPAQYDVVGEHILGTITDLLNPGQEVLDAWGALYGELAKACITREEELYKEAESKLGGWRGMREFRVKEKYALSKRVMHFELEPVDGKPVSRHSPGQYTTVWLHPEGWENRQPRHYSLTNAYGASDETASTYTIAVKKEEGGKVSSWLHDRTAVGDVINLSPPFGNFSLSGVPTLWTAEEPQPIVLLSAGVGITPMLSMLGTLKNGAEPSERKVLWLHQARNSSEHAFRDYIVGLARAHPDDLVRRVWYSAPGDSDIKGADNRAPYHFEGHMDLQQVKELMPLQSPDSEYFFCGSIGWMQSVAKQLMEMGVAEEKLHYENFGPADPVVQK
mmetsp:Transcript_62650/g.149444  ORF Transcript_62650/g.149444 Transcript_62650/m.149444 type:complete len:423 (-) Transcript_62650:74-1342(-)|eukprot:CAMPEP_0178409486 /NCGR_PEP_ID=MMETSP0689_2-20121128/20488_1 /TAXON_ID=160604 /ORGANISM="Amphidinium massartii, Strain CS-259" /LENGTH=422 /DNA_ID=CAMNT_0020030631 /DNA_START=80 /DNA_END=1348 /DNA_ORIENTATION=-